jgi:hypothetical protein
MDLLLYVAAALTGFSGIAHLFATRGVVAGFGALGPSGGVASCFLTARRAWPTCPRNRPACLPQPSGSAGSVRSSWRANPPFEESSAWSGMSGVLAPGA